MKAPAPALAKAAPELAKVLARLIVPAPARAAPERVKVTAQVPAPAPAKAVPVHALAAVVTAAVRAPAVAPAVAAHAMAAVRAAAETAKGAMVVETPVLLAAVLLVNLSTVPLPAQAPVPYGHK